MAGTLPATTMMTLKMSPQYLAAEVFRYAPLHGTAPLFHGVRKATLLFLTVPAALISGAILWFGLPDRNVLLTALPALMAIPTLSLLDGLVGDYLPLSIAPTSGRQSAIGVIVMMIGFVSLAGLAGIAALAQARGWLWHMMAGEALVLAIVHPLLLRVIRGRALSREA
jgi:hypothetical protein